MNRLLVSFCLHGATICGLAVTAGREAPAEAAGRCVASIGPAKPEAVAMVELIVTSIGLPNNITVLEGVFENNCIAVAGFVKNRRLVIYDGALFQWRNGRARWDDVGIMAHEVGHILDYHWLTRGSRPAEESVADFFAGFAVEKIGGGLADALSWSARVPEAPSPTHPGRADRIRSVALGWGSARLLRGGARPSGRGDWIGPIFAVKNNPCRLAYPDNAATLRPRIACRQEGGGWEWEQ